MGKGLMKPLDGDRLLATDASKEEFTIRGTRSRRGKGHGQEATETARGSGDGVGEADQLVSFGETEFSALVADGPTIGTGLQDGKETEAEIRRVLVLREDMLSDDACVFVQDWETLLALLDTVDDLTIANFDGMMNVLDIKHASITVAHVTGGTRVSNPEGGARRGARKSRSSGLITEDSSKFRDKWGPRGRRRTSVQAG